MASAGSVRGRMDSCSVGSLRVGSALALACPLAFDHQGKHVMSIGAALQVGRDAPAAVRFVTRRWRKHHYVQTSWECPHCGALVPSKAAIARHRMRESRVEILLNATGLSEIQAVTEADIDHMRDTLRRIGVLENAR